MLRDRYLEPRRLLAALGVDGGGADVIDELIESAGADVAPVAADPDTRRAEVAAFVAAAAGG